MISSCWIACHRSVVHLCCHNSNKSPDAQVDFKLLVHECREQEVELFKIKPCSNDSLPILTITDYQEVLIFLIEVLAFFMVSLGFLFDPQTGKVTVFLRSFPPFVQLSYDSREKTTDRLLLVKSVWFQHLLMFLVGCPQSPSL